MSPGRRRSTARSLQWWWSPSVPEAERDDGIAALRSRMSRNSRTVPPPRRPERPVEDDGGREASTPVTEGAPECVAAASSLVGPPAAGAEESDREPSPPVPTTVERQRPLLG